ncbi:HlyD family secretion protein [Anatilimnocola sp. NA78]|uniref:HlyD family secretion protein n=1 Tax=Anatilimnocola sp. NA78 TaxID=3415683 RepID=UPI003CE5B4D3
MIFVLTLLYLFVVWLIFFRFKWLPFNLTYKIAVTLVGTIGILGIYLTMLYCHPYSSQVRVFQNVIPIVPWVSQPSRVIEVAVQPNTHVKEGDVLFKLDARPFQYEVSRLQAALAAANQDEPELAAALKSAEAAIVTAQADLTDKQTDYERSKKLVVSGAIAKAELDNDEKQFQAARARLDSANASRDRAQLELDSKVGNEFTSVAQVRQQLAAAELNLAETTIVAPHDGFVTNLQIRNGSIVTPSSAVMTFVNTSDQGIVVGAFAQSALAVIAPGDPVELAFANKPGQILKGEVETIIPASDKGQLLPSGQLPEITDAARSRFAVRIKLKEDVDLPMGAAASAVVYTQTLTPLAVIQKVTIRMETFFNYISP